MKKIYRLTSGFPVGKDGRVRGTYTHNPSTLRSSMVNPSLQTMPRGNDSEVQRWVKQMFEAPKGYLFLERDFAGIESRLVGYLAQSKDYYRLAGIDCHSYFTAYNLNRLGILPNEDLPNLNWSDSDLTAALKIIKKRFHDERDIAKVSGHAANYRVGALHLSETFPQWFHKVKDAAIVLGFYYELFPDIPRWHERICLQVDKSAIITNSFGHAHRFYEVLQWEKRGNEWQWTFGNDSKRLIAFGPQSDAALIGKRVLRRLFYDYPDSIALWMRLFIHDSTMIEVPINRVDEADSIMEFEMSKPVPEMRLPPEWKMGEFVTIGNESKRGKTWASMA